MSKKKEYTIAELFAGVGGFRIGFDRVNENNGNEPPLFRTIWSNQFEPATKTQHASRAYCKAFGSEGHVNENIELVKSSDIPVHDILVGGFPCQDYSVAKALIQSEGIEGKKGVLWWQIVRIIREKGEDAPQILFLENVDRLLGSPSSQRGRDFAIILNSLDELGYKVEWRVINAADYGMPQRRRRTYILAYKKGSVIAESIGDPTEWIFSNGVFAKAFPIREYTELIPIEPILIKKKPEWSLADISSEFNKEGGESPFLSAGLMVDGVFYTHKAIPLYNGERTLLGDILATGDDRKLITEDFYISDEDLPKWKYLKGAKHEIRKTKSGFEFNYNEGGMSFPDPIDKPSRTIITSEGGKTPSRFKHVIKDPVNGRLRRLIPLELERLDMFPDNHTEGESDTKRAFFMGNALVCGIITKVGGELRRRLM